MKDAHALLERAQKENARVLLVGDTKQLSAVEAGNPFRSLQAGGIMLARLDNSLRQKTEDLRVAVKLISEGSVARGIDVLEQAGCLQIEADIDDQINQMVSDYLSLAPVEQAETLLLAGTNQERLALVKQLRRSLQAEGTLAQDALAFSSLRRKDLTQVQAQYLVAYQPGDVLMPTQDYKKQGLAKYRHYTVRNIDWAAHRLVVETADGQLLSIDPAQCRRKSVYAVQMMDVAVGDRLRWTKNDQKTKTRNGQQFTVAEVLESGIVRAVSEAGQSQWVSLSGHQHVDYAWVSTTYSAQGKTAERVLVLMSEKTMNREAFYVAVSRAKHGLKLYAANKDELLRKAQVSRAKENASDYIPLFIQVGENDAKAEKKNDDSGERSSDGEGRNIEQSVGGGVRKSAGQELSTDTLGYRRTQGACGTDRAGGAGFDRGLESVAAVFKGHVESLSGAIAGHVEQSEFIECAGLFAGAVEAVDSGFEQLECAAKNRNQLAAAVDRLDRAVGEQAQRYRFGQGVGERRLSSALRVNERERVELSKATGREHFLMLWKRYSAGIQAGNPVRLDYLVGQAAFIDGRERKEIALMLAAGSGMAKQMRASQGAKPATDYVNKTIAAVCLMRQQAQKTDARKVQKRSVEMCD